MMEAPVEMPLAVDMDGTLILTDMSVMSAKRVFLRKPWTIFSTILLELTGKRAQWNRLVAEIIAAHVGLFDDVMGSDGKINLRDHKKAEALIARYGEKGFGYAGNSVHDIPVWNHAGQVIVVNPERGLLDKVGDSADLVFE